MTHWTDGRKINKSALNLLARIVERLETETDPEERKRLLEFAQEARDMLKESANKETEGAAEEKFGVSKCLA